MELRRVVSHSAGCSSLTKLIINPSFVYLKPNQDLESTHQARTDFITMCFFFINKGGKDMHIIFFL